MKNMNNGKLNRPDVEIFENVELRAYNSMRLPARASFLALPHSPEGILKAIEFARSIDRPWFMLGGGSNVIFGEQFIDAVFIKPGKEFDYIRGTPDNSLRVGAGTPLPKLVDYCISRNIKGLASLWGIPGTLGGAIAGNAGADGSSICEFLTQVTLLDPDGFVHHISGTQLNWSYRSCELGDSIILEAHIKPGFSHPGEIQQVLKRVKTIRAKHPNLATEPSAGCIFKNPAGNSAGRLIDMAELKGTQVGGVKVSNKHANFIINTGNATPSDAVELIHLIQSRVNCLFGILLEPEVRIFGADFIKQGV